MNLGILDPVLDDPAVTEVLVNAGRDVWVERCGRLEPTALQLDETEVRVVVERVIGPLGLRLDRSSPMVDARLPDGSRLHAISPPVAVEGTCLAIRRFASEPFPLSQFGLGPEGVSLLRWAVHAGWNMLISGGTGAGKTSLLNSLTGEVPSGERIVTIEETAELRLAHPHVVRLEARPPNAEGAGAVSVRDLVRAGLRLRPDRLVVGEVRGGEAFDMVQALNTGHDGSLCTIHANGPADALTRLESLVLLAGTGLPADRVRTQISTCVDLVVHVIRGQDGTRSVTAVGEVCAGERLGVRPLLTREHPAPRRPPRRRSVYGSSPGGSSRGSAYGSSPGGSSRGAPTPIREGR